jgi:hypothetical protein
VKDQHPNLCGAPPYVNRAFVSSTYLPAVDVAILWCLPYPVTWLSAPGRCPLLRCLARAYGRSPRFIWSIYWLTRLPRRSKLVSGQVRSLKDTRSSISGSSLVMHVRFHGLWRQPGVVWSRTDEEEAERDARWRTTVSGSGREGGRREGAADSPEDDGKGRRRTTGRGGRRAGRRREGVEDAMANPSAAARLSFSLCGVGQSGRSLTGSTCTLLLYVFYYFFFLIWNLSRFFFGVTSCEILAVNCLLF